MTPPPSLRALRGGALPNLIVIGAQKCGTSALHYYVGLHPEVQVSSPKELSYFLDDADFDPGPYVRLPEEHSLVKGERNWSRGQRWYAAHFRAGARVRAEATPGYASPWFPGVAERMAATVPDAKLIFLVRDPVERAVSHYMQSRDAGREWRPIAEAMARPDNVYVGRSCYSTALAPFLERYDRERVLLVRQEQLLSERRTTLRRVFGFLGVEDGFWSPKMERERHPSAGRGWRYRAFSRLQRSPFAAPLYRLPSEAKWALERLAYRPGGSPPPALDDGLRERLLERFEPETESLERLTGWDLSAWREGAPSPPPGRSPRR